MAKQGVFIVMCLLLMGGCTQNQIDELGLGKYIHEFKPARWEEALLAHAFTNSSGQYEHTVKSNMSKFLAGEEAAAQESLSNDKVGLATVWTNDFYGEITFIPNKREYRQGQQCRRFKAEYVFTGTYRTKQTQSGRACLNAKTLQWEWNTI